MDFHNYLLFVGACVMLCALPGPDMILLLTRSLAQGRRAGLMAALGVNAGSYFHLLAAIAGISAIIASSAYAFMVVKFAGAGYLIYLGIAMLRSSGGLTQAQSVQILSCRSCFWQGFLSDVLNPKVAIFYLAFLPQFVVPGSGVLKQLIVLGITANVIGIFSSLTIVLCASAFRTKFLSDYRMAGFLGKLLGSVFIALGVRLAGEKAL